MLSRLHALSLSVSVNRARTVAAAGDHVMCACLQNLTPMCGTRIGLGDPRNHNPEHHIMALLTLPSYLLRRRTGNLIW